MGVIRRPSAVPVTATSDDGTAQEVLNDMGLTDNGMTTDDGGSEIEPDLESRLGNDGSQSGRIRLLASRRSHFRRSNARSRHPAIPANTAPPPKLSTHGSKKFRRYENQLELLKECDENEPGEVSIEDFIPNPQGPGTFTKIFREANMKNMWNLVVDCATGDDVPTSSRGSHSNKKLLKPYSGDSSGFDPDEAFQGICRKLRALLKQRHFPLGMMETLEETMIEFFASRPEDTFESDPMDGFRRGMLHALSQYNKLRSHSVKCKESTKDSIKKVRVQPMGQPFCPPPVRLVVYLETKYRNPDVMREN